MLLAGAFPARAETPAHSKSKDGTRKPAWKWTLDERLAARFDPEAMAAREAKRQARMKELLKGRVHRVFEEKAEITEAPSIKEALDGGKTPELFLPSELFDVLLSRGFPQESSEQNLQEFRDWIESQAAGLGIGQDFWKRLEGATLPYLQEDRHPFFSAKYGGVEEDLHLCRLRAEALKAAEAEFGEEAVLRLLYGTVARGWSFTRVVGLGPGPSTYERYEEELRFQEGGCR
ncbi:MAG TPA: hypothetical protein VGX68_15930 [Thermoanaerobaculia bacterium]|nr:hypothetical protein [Thermoanaerobaculia bacterium]